MAPETYINHPLETSQSTNHDNTHGKTVPEPTESNFPVDTAHDFSKGFTRLSIGIEFADHDISGMRDNGTENTSEITTSEGYTGLGSFSVVALLSRQAVINHFHNSFKRGKLHHGIWDLTSPQWIQSLVEASVAFFASNCVDSVECACIRVGNCALHSHLDGFKRAKGHIGQKFGRGRGGQIDGSLVVVCSFWSSHVAVSLLEVFIPTILESSLGTVSEECRAPTSHDATETFGAIDFPPSLKVASVELRIDLASGLDKIERRHSSVGKTLYIDSCG